jgi:hypothetical protein
MRALALTMGPEARLMEDLALDYDQLADKATKAGGNPTKD